MKPFLKWVGGKTQILPDVLKTFPESMQDYHEPFLGGGSVLLEVLQTRKDSIKGKVYAYDVNEDLINVYIDVKEHPKEVHQYIMQYISEYQSIQEFKGEKKPSNKNAGMTSKESYYYWMRNRFNSIEKSIEKSAMLIVMNKLCFRGVYRSGPNGFNVPFGHPKTTPKMISIQELIDLSKLFKDTEFTCCDFETSIGNVKKGDFMYCDPPYVDTFVGYVKDGFTNEQHKKLFKLLRETKGKFVMSNSNNEIIQNEFEKFTIDVIECRRAINSKNPGAVATEVLVRT